MLIFKTLLTLFLLWAFTPFSAYAQQKGAQTDNRSSLANDRPLPVIQIKKSPAPPTFGLPIACTLGKTCWILNYPDVGPDGDGTGIDPACNARTYEGHKGTDIAIPDEKTMITGVDVLAARDGTVTRARDGEPDRWPDAAALEQVKKDRKECGNAVLIDHGDGWQTMYCHMKKGSVSVKAGQPVKAGEKIGQVGLSGYTQFPHVHFGITHNNTVMDPFNGHALTDACGGKGKSLWNPSLKMAYEPLVIFDASFDVAAPSLPALGHERQNHDTLDNDADALVFYTVLLGVREGDRINLSVTGPDGKVFAERAVVQDKTRAQQMYFVGRKAPSDARLKDGIYKGIITITRPDSNAKNQPLVWETAKSVTVE